VGIGTVLADDPKLTVKEKYVPDPKQPIRIVLDSTGRTPKNAEILSHEAKTIIFVSEEFNDEFEGAEIIVCGKEKVNLPKLCQILDERGIKILLVEGGEAVIWSFLKEKLVDEFNIFIGSMIIGGEKSPTPAGGEGVKTEGDILGLDLKKVEKMGDGILLSYGVKK
jgi:2,5-diamino-6-(ribosylamino)-4(3H)-pyrimidinone 5'-phosphate reductase